MATHLGRGRRRSAPRTSTRTSSPGPGGVPRGLSVGSGPGQGGDAPGHGGGPRGRRLVALTLSDPFCVERHRREFLELLHGDVDVLFANEDEMTLLFGARLVRRRRGRRGGDRAPGRAHPGRGRVGGRGRLGPGGGRGRRRSSAWSTPPGPETSSRRGSSTASPMARPREPAAGWAGCARPRSSPTSGPGPRPTCALASGAGLL